VRGYGKLTGPRTVTVGNQNFTARKAVVIATGSRPVMPSVPGLSDTDFWTTHNVIQMEKLPGSMIILGGGASGCELGQVLARFGVGVTIIEARDRLLPGEEPEASETVETAFAGEGIKIHTGTGVQRVDSRNGSFVVTLGGGQEITSERLLVTTGRRVELSGLGLQSVGIDETADFLPVDENMRVRDNIFGMGDVTGKGFYSHVGLYQSAIIASRILGKDHLPASYHAVPRGTFTDPEVGSVGMTEAQALDAGIPVAVALKQIPATFRGAVHGAETGFIKLIAEREKDILIGATVAGPYGVDILGMLNLAVHTRIPVTQLRSMMYAFPSFYSTIGEAVGAYGRGVTTVLDPSYEGSKILDAMVNNIGHHSK
jgi:pyruvate/2-oxoglutarate dehydrogenase complex dihydrolipoamide dehydrogenase (E3) component